MYFHLLLEMAGGGGGGHNLWTENWKKAGLLSNLIVIIS